jgi:hypothetical protein
MTNRHLGFHTEDILKAVDNIWLFISVDIWTLFHIHHNYATVKIPTDLVLYGGSFIIQLNVTVCHTLIVNRIFYHIYLIL